MKTSKILLGGVCAALCLTLTGCGDGKMKLKKDEFKVEFGKKVSDKPSTYVEADKDVLKDAKVTIKNKKYYKQGDRSYKDYGILKPGKYKGVVAYGDEKEEFTLNVKDTKAPVCYDEEIEVPNTTTKEDLDKTILSEGGGCFDKFGSQFGDSEKLKLKKVSGKYDLKKEGVYRVTYRAIDKAGNKSEKFEMKIKVVKAVKSISVQSPNNKDSGASIGFKFEFDEKGDMVKTTFILKAPKGSKAYDAPQSTFEEVGEEAFKDVESEANLEGGNRKYTKNANEAVYTYETTPSEYNHMTYKDVMDLVNELGSEAKPVIEYYK